jgi:hypothetical protein
MLRNALSNMARTIIVKKDTHHFVADAHTRRDAHMYTRTHGREYIYTNMQVAMYVCL